MKGLTGENFLRIDNHDERLEKMLTDLRVLRRKWADEYYNNDDFTYEALYKIEDKIEHLKRCIYAYVYNRYGFERAMHYDKKYLW